MLGSRELSLQEYVRRRNGVPLGAPGSLSNMLRRSLGADSFHSFWQYWNPIWGYYLGTKVFRPLSKLLPDSIALILTFSISGAIHDCAVTLVRSEPTMLFTPWFSLMGILVVVSKALQVSFRNYSLVTRICLNTTLIIGSFLLIRLLGNILSG